MTRCGGEETASGVQVDWSEVDGVGYRASLSIDLALVGRVSVRRFLM